MFRCASIKHTGKEFNCGIYISSVLSSSKAALAGVKVSMYINTLCVMHKSLGVKCEYINYGNIRRVC